MTRKWDVEGERDPFAGKVRLRVKGAVAGAFVAVFLVSFFSGTYSLASGHSLFEMMRVVGEHLAAYFNLWGQFLAHPVTTPSADPADIVGNFFGNLYDALVGAGAGDHVSDRKLDLALFSIRLPRILLALVVGAALSCAGAAFQGMFKNPLVSPDLLGASAGASLGACIAMLNGMGNCTGSAKATFEIAAADVSRCAVYQKASSYSYTGRGVQPAVVLRLGGVRIPASEYRLSYYDASGAALPSAPVEIGSYSVRVSGTGDNLNGFAFASFDIVQAPVGECQITLDGAWYDFGAQVKPAVSVATSAGVALDSSEFTVTYGPGAELGARSWVYVEAAGGHLTGTTYSLFTIGRIPISSGDVKFAGGGSYDWTGKEIRPVPTIAIGERVLKQGVDFNVEYLGDCTSIGTQPVEITCPATSAFTSDATAKYEIVKPAQAITVASKFAKTFGSVKTFKLNAKANGDGKLSYSSSNTKVATVSSAGVVTVKAVGTAKVTVKCAAGKMWKAAPSKTVTVVVSKAAQPLKASGKTATASVKTLQKKNVTIARSKLIAVSKPQGKVTYKKTSGNAKIAVSSAGKFTAKKGLKKGTYTVKVKVTAAGNANYKSGSKTTTCKLRVK